MRLEKTEEIIHKTQRHGIVYFGWWLLVFVLIVTPFFFMFWLFNHNWWGQALFFFSLVLGIFFLARTVFLWKNNSAIITTHRIIDVDQRGFFDKFVSEMPYDQLDYVSGRIKGFWGTIWRYGFVTIQNENGNMKIVLDKVKHPARVQRNINEMRKKYNLRYLEDPVFLEDKFSDMRTAELVKIKKMIEREIEARDIK